MRLIDADELMKRVNHFCDHCMNKMDLMFCVTHCVVQEFRREVRDAPTVVADARKEQEE